MPSIHCRRVAALFFRLACVGILSAAAAPAGELPDGMVHVSEVAPEVLQDIRYYGVDNFMGARADGYEAPAAILSREAAEALKRASDAAKARGYFLKIFDAYRPRRAERHFVRWAMDPDDVANRELFYPDLEKSDLLGPYIAVRSGHSRGSTVDLTLVDRRTGGDVDMGSPFDFFGVISHHDTPLITPEQAANRETLMVIMRAAGFRPYSGEWWHYTLINEPFPDTHFDFVVR